MKTDIRVNCSKCGAALEHENIPIFGVASIILPTPCPVCLDFRDVSDRVNLRSYHPPHYVIKAVVKYLLENTSDTIDINGYMREINIYDRNTILLKTIPYESLGDL